MINNFIHIYRISLLNGIPSNSGAFTHLAKNINVKKVIIYGNAYAKSLASPIFVNTLDIHSEINNEKINEVTAIHSIFHAPTIIIAKPLFFTNNPIFTINQARGLTKIDVHNPSYPPELIFNALQDGNLS